MTTQYRVFIPKIVPEISRPFLDRLAAVEAAHDAAAALRRMGNARHVVEGVRIQVREFGGEWGMVEAGVRKEHL